MKRIDAGVKAYFDSVDPADRKVLESLRKLVLGQMPEASETMLYGMPTYLLSTPVASFKRQKSYFSLYVSSAEAVAEHAQELGALNCGKCCIRFRKWEQLPQETIAKILQKAARQAGFRDLPSGGAPGAAAC